MGMAKTVGAAVVVTAILTAVLTLVVVGGVFWFWFGRIYTEDMTLIQLSRRYRAVVSGKPEIAARVYSLGHDDRYLLVLATRSRERAEGYYVDLFNREVGLPDFPAYMSLFKYAIVDRLIYNGVPEIGILDVNWNVEDDMQQIHMHIRGFAQEEPGDTEAITKKQIPLAYGSDIVLIRTE